MLRGALLLLLLPLARAGLSVPTIRVTGRRARAPQVTASALEDAHQAVVAAESPQQGLEELSKSVTLGREEFSSLGVFDLDWIMGGTRGVDLSNAFGLRTSIDGLRTAFDEGLRSVLDLEAFPSLPPMVSSFDLLMLREQASSLMMNVRVAGVALLLLSVVAAVAAGLLVGDRTQDTPCDTPCGAPCSVPCNVPCVSSCDASCDAPCDAPCSAPYDAPRDAPLTPRICTIQGDRSAPPEERCKDEGEGLLLSRMSPERAAQWDRGGWRSGADLDTDQCEVDTQAPMSFAARGASHGAARGAAQGVLHSACRGIVAERCARSGAARAPRRPLQTAGSRYLVRLF